MECHYSLKISNKVLKNGKKNRLFVFQAYIPQQPGMQPSMPPGNRMYGQQQMGAHQQMQPQQIQDMAQAQGVHYQG